MRKNYVLDTNILLSDHNSLFGFDDNRIWITGTTMQELDHKKELKDEVGFNARRVVKFFDEHIGSILKGEEIPLPNNGSLMFERNGVDERNLPKGFDIEKPDNRIISTCVHIQNSFKEPVVLVTNDTSMRVNAALCGIKAEGYLNEESTDYAGHRDIEVEDYEVITEIYENKKIVSPEKYHENEFITLHCGNQSALSVYRAGELNLVKPVKLFGAIPMNAMQTYASWALSQPASELPLVILKGPAGTAKTYLSIAAGLDKSYTDGRSNNIYRKILISRPNTMAGDEAFGYLPGDLNEKMTPLLLPYYDNLESLLAKTGTAKEEDIDDVTRMIEDMFSLGIIDICALSYIRGRSISNSYLICDESQNASRQLIKDVITRCGENTKIVLAGDPDQCDNPRLNKKTNGLVYASEVFKDSALSATITFENKHSVRSILAKEAVSLMGL